MGSLFGEAAAAYNPDDEEDPNDPLKNRGDIPYATPNYGPPAPTPPSGGINPIQGGFRGPENPANVTPGDQYAPHPDMGVFTPFHPINEAVFGPQGIATPYLEPARNFLGNVGGAFLSPLDTLTNPIGPGSPGGPPQQAQPGVFNAAGQMLGQGLVPNSIEEIGINAIGAKSPLEAITGLPIGDLWQRGGGAAREAFNAAMPEPSLFPGMSAGIPPIHPNGGEMAFGPGSLGGGLPMPQPSGSLEDQLRASLEARGVTPPAPPPFPASYPSIPEGTMASEFPDVVAASRGRIDPNSPAARMGAPLAYDPQFMTPPPADAAMRELGVAPVDNMARPEMAQELSARMEGGVPEASSSASPPPSNLAPDVPSSGLLPERTATPDFTTIGEPYDSLTPSERVDRLIQEAQNQPVIGDVGSLSNEEIIQQANRLGVPVDEGAIMRGTPAARDPEIAKVQAAADAELNSRGANSMTNATDNVFNHFWELQGERQAQDTADKIQRWSDQFGDYGGGGRAGEGSKAGGVMRQIMDILYTPFGGDLSSVLRQDSMRMLNPLRAGESIDVLKDTGRAIASHDEAIQLAQELRQRAEALVPNPHLSDWQGGAFANRETMYSSLLNKLPGYEALNRGFATEINSRRVNAIERFASAHPDASPALLQTEWNRLERTTGRGSLGSDSVEKALSKAGPLFTSLRFAASIPERTASLVPFTRLTDGSFQMFGPVWRESVKDHAGFIGTVLTAMAAAQQAGLKVGWDPNNQTGGSNGRVPFGAIQLPNGSFVDLTGGAKKYVNAVVQLATGEKNGKDYPWLLEQAQNGQYKGTVAEFVRNMTGPVVQFSAAAAKEAGVKGKGIEFLRPDFWDKGVTGNGSFADRAAQFVTPLWIQDVATAVRASAEGQKLQGGAAAAPLSFLGAGVQTYDSTAPNPLAQMRNEALGSAKYSDLLPKEQQALNEALQKKDPEGYAKALAASQESQNPIIRENQATREAIKNDRNAQIAPIVAGVKDGLYSPGAAYAAIKQIQDAASLKTAELLRDPKYLDATKDFTNADSVARRALDAYYAVPNSAKGPDGKIDWNRVEQVRAELIASLDKAGQADVARRLLRETETTNLYDDLKKLAPVARK